MIEDQLNELTKDIGGLPATLFVRVHLKDEDSCGTNPEGHIPSTSYIQNNVLTLYTDSTMKLPSFLIPPPMVRYIEVVRESGSWGVKLVGFTQKIPAIKNIRAAFKSLQGNVLGLKEAKDMVEAHPAIMMEGLDKGQAERFMNKVIEGGVASCCLVRQGAEVDTVAP